MNHTPVDVYCPTVSTNAAYKCNYTLAISFSYPITMMRRRHLAALFLVVFFLATAAAPQKTFGITLCYYSQIISINNTYVLCNNIISSEAAKGAG